MGGPRGGGPSSTPRPGRAAAGVQIPRPARGHALCPRGPPGEVARESALPSGTGHRQLRPGRLPALTKGGTSPRGATSEVLPQGTPTQAGAPTTWPPASHTAGPGPLLALPGTSCGWRPCAWHRAERSLRVWAWTRPWTCWVAGAGGEEDGRRVGACCLLSGVRGQVCPLQDQRGGGQRPGTSSPEPVGAEAAGTAQSAGTFREGQVRGHQAECPEDSGVMSADANGGCLPPRSS